MNDFMQKGAAIMGSYGMHKRVSRFSLFPAGRARYTSWRVRHAVAYAQATGVYPPTLPPGSPAKLIPRRHALAKRLL